MATHDVDQKLLGRLARQKQRSMPDVYNALCQLLGLSVQLAKRLIRARQLRKLDTSRETQSPTLYQHILWLSREGLSIVDTRVLERQKRPTSPQELGIELYIFALKLRASFFHVFCLFHNNPTINSLKPTAYSPPRNGRTPLSPTNGNGRVPSSSKRASASAPEPQLPSSRERRETLRETIPSLVSEASYITNPYAEITPPPGIKGKTAIPNSSAFLLPSVDFRPQTTVAFNQVANLAQGHLSIFHPLRLSIILEQSAFYWDCLHDYSESRSIARRALREIRRQPDPPMDNATFRDVATLTGTLGRMTARQSVDETPLPTENSQYMRAPTMADPTQATRRERHSDPRRQSQPSRPPAAPNPQVATHEPTPSPSPHRVKRKPVGSSSNSGQIREAPGINPILPYPNIPTPKPTPKRSATRSPSPRGSPQKSARRSKGSRSPSPRASPPMVPRRSDERRKSPERDRHNGPTRTGGSPRSQTGERRSSDRHSDERKSSDRRSDERRSSERRSDERKRSDGRAEERRSGESRDEKRRTGERNSSGSKSSSSRSERRSR